MRMNTTPQNRTGHDTVFLDEALQYLDIQPNDVVVDATVGGAGHFARILETLSADGTVVGIDADEDALERARKVVADSNSTARSEFVEDNFRNLDAILEKLGIPYINKSIFDLGWSGFQLTVMRGFSFQNDEPLLMTYGKESANTAAQIVNMSSEKDLADILHTFGEERFSRRIAHSIVAARRQARILTTNDLVDAVCAGTPSWYRNRRIHPATKTFQALRIAVNEELDALREGLLSAISRTQDGGRIAVITFHSIEDRIVKTIFRDATYAGRGMTLTRKPVVPSREMLARNRRAHSAKLRVFSCGTATVPPSFTNTNHHAYA